MGLTLLGKKHDPLPAAMATVKMLIKKMSDATQDAVLVAISGDGWTPATLQNMYRAEQAGRNRRIVLLAIERRITEVGGEMAAKKTRLVIAGRALEPGEAAWGKSHPTLKR